MKFCEPRSSKHIDESMIFDAAAKLASAETAEYWMKINNTLTVLKLDLDRLAT